MSGEIRRGPSLVEVSLVNVKSTEEPAVLLQLPDGFVLMQDPTQIRQLAGALIEASDDLERALNV